MCGARQHCQKHSDSILGGFCVDSDTSTNQRGNKIWKQFKRQSTSTSSTATHVNHKHRQLQNGVDPNFEEELGFDFVASDICNNANYTCSTCSYGDDAAERVFECTYAEDYCGTEVDDFCGGGDGTPVCYNYVLAGQQDDESQQLTFCLKLVQPAQLEYCYTRILTGGDEYSCAFSVNGQVCNSCTIAAPQQQSDCFIFDCENTDLPISGNTCTYNFDGLVTRTIEQAILPCEGGCTLCKEGEIISNVNAIVPLEQGDASCGAVAISALTGDGPFADPAYCASLNTLAGEICGCYNPTEGVYIPSNITDTPVSTPTEAPTEEDDEPTMLLDIIDEICADGSGYICSTCEVDRMARTATFDCAVPEYCENRPSFCTKPLNFCLSRTFQGSFTSDDIYEYEFCSTIKTTPSDEVYQFDYCITYNISPDNDSCKIEIDGIECTSCTANYSDETQVPYASFDCRNTLLGRTGDNFRALYVMEETEDYFAYRALPCPGGCNLCGDDDARMMNLTATFTITSDDTGTEQVCSEAQLAALTGPTDTSFCEGMQASVRGPCQCQDPSSPTPSPTPAPEPDNLDGSGDQSLGVSNALATTAVMMVGAIFLLIQ
ncbi:hypothetical protein IV203_028107 [Nitzschia inconspicua]|uniref:Uncharacterized protein n=1 Tax=Nitzschia inconspicua TaxID=303405 RepID=A0A9K3Q4G9_9STRA|nr:hypothetical protein IV203_028107 [Nitzschia inconspicua]